MSRLPPAKGFAKACLAITVTVSIDRFACRSAPLCRSAPPGRNALRGRDTLRSRDTFPWLRASGRRVEVEKLLLLRGPGPAVPVKVCRVRSLLPSQAALFPGADLLLVRYFLRRSRFPGGSGFSVGAVAFSGSVVFGESSVALGDRGSEKGPVTSHRAGLRGVLPPAPELEVRLHAAGGVALDELPGLPRPDPGVGQLPEETAFRFRKACLRKILLWRILFWEATPRRSFSRGLVAAPGTDFLFRRGFLSRSGVFP